MAEKKKPSAAEAAKKKEADEAAAVKAAEEKKAAEEAALKAIEEAEANKAAAEEAKKKAADEAKAKEEAERLAEKFFEEQEDIGYVVAEGHCITSKVGILEAGKTVRLKDISGGEEAFHRLIETRHIVEA